MKQQRFFYSGYSKQLLTCVVDYNSKTSKHIESKIYFLGMFSIENKFFFGYIEDNFTVLFRVI